ncbi:glycosyltransferase [Desulforhabdus sp. TSK]|uniref:glycosyltransferase n=1 Tax=Desulforhabdus sp. TSK TaxID=2925014 RepID=UPI001FC8741C|nr:glycosyltransferase [Desulforhabdus sp. TSK]GKT10727.1 hypothetical protein DSTSK_40320 [Desulforhabdus sp. TSK]
MKIVNIIQRYPPAVGGSETWCQEVCRYLAQKGHNVKVLTLDINKEQEFWRDPLDPERNVAFGKMMLDQGVLVRRYRRSIPIHTVFHVIYKRILDRMLKVYFYGPHSAEMYGRMWREIKAADLVFLHTVPYPHNFIAYALARLFGKKTIFAPHFHPTHPDYERRSHYWLLRSCDAVITVSEFEKQYLQSKNIPGDRIFVTGNAVHPDHYLPHDLENFASKLRADYSIQPDERLVVFIGRKTPEKGVAHLVRAVKELIRKMPVRLFMVGPGFDWYHDLYNGLSHEEKNHIIEMGVLSHQDKVNLLHLCDLLVLPSRYEAFGIVFLEAWICGIPVMGTTEGAMPSVIGSEGFLCRYGDEEHLKAMLAEALSDKDRLKELGSRGYDKVRTRFTWDRIGAEVQKAADHAFGRKKIILCTNAYPPHFIGGAELIAHEHAKILKKMGHEVIVFAGEPNPKRKRYSLRRDSFEGIPVHRICLHQRDYSSDFVNFYHEEVQRAFAALVEIFAPDVVHFHNIMGLSVGLIQIAKLKKIRTILTLHDYWGVCHKNTLMKHDGSLCQEPSVCEDCQAVISGQTWQGIPTSMRRDYISQQIHLVDAIVSPSRYLADRYVKDGFDGSKFEIIPYGIDTDRFAPAPGSSGNGKVRFSFVGYLGRHKGVYTILEALPLVEGNDRMVFTFIGEGDQKEHLQREVKLAGLSDCVRFRGKVQHSKVETVYRETDVLVLPSIWPDNHPVSIYEAMASGIPVIASRLGGIPELVTDGVTGHLFEHGNACQLAQKMSECLADRSKLAVMGEAGRKNISELTLERQVGRLVEAYLKDGRSRGDEIFEQPMILCIGKKMDPECAEALSLFLKSSQGRYRVFMVDWLEEDLVSHAKLLWVVDRTVDSNEVMMNLRHKLPLLVPEQHEGLKQACIQGNCGLYYRDAMEALACLEFLTENKGVSVRLGQCGFKYFSSHVLLTA